MESRFLGKITKASLGHGGYQDAVLGLLIHIDGGTSAIDFTALAWDSNKIMDAEGFVRKVNTLLFDAKVSSVEDLVGKPVMVTYVDNIYEGFRILTEVL